MFQFFVNAEGGLTTTGYAVTIVAAILLTIAAIILAGKKSTKKKLSFITSYIKIFELPFGGSVTAFSMLFIVLIAYWYGPKTGVLRLFSFLFHSWSGWIFPQAAKRTFLKSKLFSIKTLTKNRNTVSIIDTSTKVCYLVCIPDSY